LLNHASAREIRSHLDHPVIDADGHYIETMPILKPYVIDSVRELAGADLAKRIEAGEAGFDYDDTVLRPWSEMTAQNRLLKGVTRPPWWSLPAANTLDRATAHLPRLMAQRLDDMGIDFSVMYPSRTLTATSIGDAELRQVVCRSLNRFYAEVYRPYADRMTAVAQIPTHTPEEAIAELNYAVQELGFKAIMINGLIHRPLLTSAGDRPAWGGRPGSTIDTLGLDSPYDYDPFWRRCVELKVNPATHTPGMGWGSRQSPTNYMYNHIGSFGAAMEATCKSLFMAGVTRRFPQLSFGMLEGGVGWACTLLNDLIGHWDKRNSQTIGNLDPARIDTDLLLQLFNDYGDDVFSAKVEGLRESFTKLEPLPPVLDEWTGLDIASEQELIEAFVPKFYFGCEADDSSVAWAFNRELNPEGSRLQAMFSSDAGHWDVSDMTEVLVEAYELVEHGHISDADFKDFVFTFPASFYGGLNRNFFRGTRVEHAAAALLKPQA
jgi:predicted TIM-barrel fold metal-dependent hydrolase